MISEKNQHAIKLTAYDAMINVQGNKRSNKQKEVPVASVLPNKSLLYLLLDLKSCDTISLFLSR